MLKIVRPLYIYRAGNNEITTCRGSIEAVLEDKRSLTRIYKNIDEFVEELDYVSVRATFSYKRNNYHIYIFDGTHKDIKFPIDTELTRETLYVKESDATIIDLANNLPADLFIQYLKERGLVFNFNLTK